MNWFRGNNRVVQLLETRNSKTIVSTIGLQRYRERTTFETGERGFLPGAIT